MADGRGSSSSRLSVDDWIQAGYAILAEEGIKALKIDRLCSRLGVTKGSFTGISPTWPDIAPRSWRPGASCATTTAAISASWPTPLPVIGSRK